MALPYLTDPDFTLYNGDVLEVLRELPDESVDCVVTSPPYWGLRDYGTGEWDGGDEGCDHSAAKKKTRYDYPLDTSPIQDGTRTGTDGQAWHDSCPCGATRLDRQLGLEPTPEEYVERMTEVFREVRRVLAEHGTCWLNMGDSYNANVGAGFNANARIGQQNTVLPSGLPPKNLLGMPWRLAFALQADGWYLRSDIVWSKPNPMPESVTDRPTKAHEYVFLLTKQPRYFFDQEAVREPHQPDGRIKTAHDHATDNGHENYAQMGDGRERWPNSGRNIRSVWEIATQPFSEAHFATFPQALVERCLKAGCPEQVCGECGKARERVVERTPYEPPIAAEGERFVDASRGDKTRKLSGADYNRSVRVIGESWSDCACGKDAPALSDRNPSSSVGVPWNHEKTGKYRPGIVLDPFMGSGTVALVARRLSRRSIGIELNEDYCAMAAKRLQQLSLLTELA